MEATDSRDKSGMSRSSEPLSGEKYSPKVSLSFSFLFLAEGKTQGLTPWVLGSFFETEFLYVGALAVLELDL